MYLLKISKRLIKGSRRWRLNESFLAVSLCYVASGGVYYRLHKV